MPSLLSRPNLKRASAWDVVSHVSSAPRVRPTRGALNAYVVGDNVPRACALFAACCVFLSACARPPHPAAPTSATSRAPAGPGAYSATDDLGKTIILAKRPERIVSLSPAHTEMLFALGAGSRVVGVTAYCDYPKEAKSLPKVSEFSKINAEKVAGLEPDLIIAAHGNPSDDLRQIESLGVPVFGADPKTYDEVAQCIERLGALVGAPEEGKAVASRLREARERVDALVGSRPQAERPVVLITHILIETPTWLPGKGTLHDDLIRLAGGRNVVPEAQEGWKPLALETLVERAPEVIVATHPEGKADAAEGARLLGILRGLNGWNGMPAVKKGRVYAVLENTFLRPGPRLGEALVGLAEILAGEKPATGGSTGPS